MCYCKIPSNEVENVIEEMLNVFSNETENGKMYISYPMVEAIYLFYKVPHFTIKFLCCIYQF